MDDVVRYNTEDNHHLTFNEPECVFGSYTCTNFHRQRMGIF